MPSDEYIAIANMLLVIHSCITPIVLYKLDNRIQGNIRKFLRLSISNPSRSNSVPSNPKKAMSEEQPVELAKTKIISKQ